MLYDPNWKLPEAPVEIPAKVKKIKAKSKRKTWRTLMLDAANVLKKQGWIRGSLHQKGEGFCTLGALIRVDRGSVANMKKGIGNGSQSFKTAQRKLEERLHSKYGCSIVSWNDCRVTDSEEIIRTLREVAKS